MPNLTSYRASPIHLKRELPKTYCDLIRHEADYTHFLRTRVAKMHSSLSFTNKNCLIPRNTQSSRRYFDHSQRLFHVYQRNVELCRRILAIWASDGPQQGGVDCHNEDYHQQTNISHFRLRQARWKDTIEKDNQRLIRSLVYRRKNYRPAHDRSTAQRSFAKHLKLVKTMSQYPNYSLTNSLHRSLLNFKSFPSDVYYNFSRFYSPNSEMTVRTQCQALPRPYLQRTQKSSGVKIQEDKRAKTKPTPTYVESLLQQTTADAVRIYNQPLPSASQCVEGSSNDHNRRLQRRSHPRQDASCRQLLEPWHHVKSEEELRDRHTANADLPGDASRLLHSYRRIRRSTDQVR